ncbi:hypothetical protein CLOBOL_00056 [Enterocloster bolteae ATCC BAA-613]|uniref:Uncharacterized protein n=1 Tax=Enterocloster bolteae (strain ATCC BAA-613 / DSM 15670 / CCUG 46953 / JCM 12243 / WAL 16351) TaxID=411902 RepID=A8RG65_ENTBW|nr:hypothetical protein CLOBOL_00056 [Enterocloster bolteae ATCC BAA-613]
MQFYICIPLNLQYIGMIEIPGSQPGQKDKKSRMVFII